MEPANLNSSSAADDDRQLETFLRQVQPTLPDAGFSHRVLAALPPSDAAPAPRHRLPARSAICFAGALAGLAVAARRISHDDVTATQEAVANVAAAFRPLENATTGLFMALAAVGLSLLYAFSRSLRGRHR